jgi:hypothetical protein
VSSAPVLRDQLLDDRERRHLTETCMPLYRQALADLVEKPAGTAHPVGQVGAA